MSGRPTTEDLICIALEHFDAAAVAPAEGPWRQAVWREWIVAGHHADMRWLASTVDARAELLAHSPDARAWLVVAQALRTETPPPELWNDPLRGRIARYAWGPDYHDAMRERLMRLAEKVRKFAGLAAAPKWFVDSAPVPEKELAERGVLGFTGCNTLIISEALGSWLSLGGLVLPWRPAGVLPFDPARAALAAERGCGSCRRCRSVCPTGALVADRILDARQCIAWATIECRGEIPLAVRGRLNRWLAGCDLCQECCPWNFRAALRNSPRIPFDPTLYTPTLAEALSLTPELFGKRYGHSAVARLGWRRWIRNALMAAATAPKDSAIRTAVHRYADSSEPLIRASAHWAQRRIDMADEPSDE